MNSSANCSINNIYKLEGRVPLGKAIPFGLQHILAMFVSNLAPITIIAGAAQPALTQAQTAILLQNAMFVAGIATLVQLYPVWRIGSRLPVVMGVSFTFVTVLSTLRPITVIHPWWARCSSAVSLKVPWVFWPNTGAGSSRRLLLLPW